MILEGYVIVERKMPPSHLFLRRKRASADYCKKIALSDVQSAEPHRQGSWLRVAGLMGCKPEMAVLRRFQKLNILRLLEMQSDLAQKECEYDILCSLDAKVDCPTTRSYQIDWTALNESQGTGGSLQRDAWRKLRDGLESYSMSTSTHVNVREESLTFAKTMHYYSRSRSASRLDLVSTT